MILGEGSTQTSPGELAQVVYSKQKGSVSNSNKEYKYVMSGGLLNKLTLVFMYMGR